MGLERVEIEMVERELPGAAVELLRREEELRREFNQRCIYQPPGGFFPGDYARAYAALAALWESPLRRGEVFCEWGSGTGAITLLAAQLGYQAHGIEVQQELVDLATELAEGAAEFACGTLVPAAARASLPAPEEATLLDNDGEDGHAVLELDPAAIDLVYCFPWPGEEGIVERLFAAVAGPGALLMTYDGDEDILIHRQTGTPTH